MTTVFVCVGKGASPTQKDIHQAIRDRGAGSKARATELLKTKYDWVSPRDYPPRAYQLNRVP